MLCKQNNTIRKTQDSTTWIMMYFSEISRMYYGKYSYDLWITYWLLMVYWPIICVFYLWKGYRSVGSDTVWIKCWVCHSSSTVIVVKWMCLHLLCKCFSVRLSPLCFHLSSSGCIFHETRFSSLFSKVSKLFCLDLRFRFGV